MADVPETPDQKTKTAVTQRIRNHVKRGWPHLGEPVVSFRGQFCYVAARLSRRSRAHRRSCGCATRDQPTGGASGSTAPAASRTPNPSSPPRSDRKPAPRNRASTTPSSSTRAPKPATYGPQRTRPRPRKCETRGVSRMRPIPPPMWSPCWQPPRRSTTRVADHYAG